MGVKWRASYATLNVAFCTDIDGNVEKNTMNKTFQIFSIDFINMCCCALWGKPDYFGGGENSQNLKKPLLCYTVLM